MTSHADVDIKFGDASRQQVALNIHSLADALLVCPDSDEVVLPGSKLSVGLGGLRDLIKRAYHMTPKQFAALSPHRRDRMTKQLRAQLEREFRKQYPEQWLRYSQQGVPATISNLLDPVILERRRERTALHVALRSWALGPLVLERPQGSSYHHLLTYDSEIADPTGVTMEEINRKCGEPQVIVVESDWARTIGQKNVEAGAIRLPFPRCCWEFRISGVRVLAMTTVQEQDHSTILFCVYGRDGIWVADDYLYTIGDDSGALVGQAHAYAPDDSLETVNGRYQTVEFRRVSELVWLQIKAACVLLDMQATRIEHVLASPKLVERRQREGKSPPRNHVVVRLVRTAHPRPRVAGSRGMGVGGGPRAAQRGHLRRGTWVHFDDQDSGEVKYINSGGFWVSKSWRKWHFAGDMSNMIDREYRL